MARPLAFDPQEKLHQAMMLFWRHGYEATSLQDLVSELKINRFSLYNTFGDKQALFAKTVDLYEQKVFGSLLEALKNGAGGAKALNHYFDQLSRGLCEQTGVKGCFLQNTLLEGGVSDEAVIERIRGVFLRLRAALLKNVEQMKALGEVKPEVASDEMADFLLLQVQRVDCPAWLGGGGSGSKCFAPSASAAIA